MLTRTCFPYTLSSFSPAAEFVSSPLDKKDRFQTITAVPKASLIVLRQQPDFYPKTILTLDTFQQGNRELYPTLGKYYSFTLVIKHFKRTRQENQRLEMV